MTGKQIVLNNIISNKQSGTYSNPDTAKKQRQIRILTTLKNLK